MKKIAVFLPDLPQLSYLKPIEQSLSFLTPEYGLDFIDPYEIHEEVSNEFYYTKWQERIKNCDTQYDAFLGFSFGGVILQQCYPILECLEKPLLLFSTPSFANERLRTKLNRVIELCRKQRVQEGLQYLYQHVSRRALPTTTFPLDNEIETAQRIIFGLQRVIDTDATEMIRNTQLSYTHFIGEASNLVKRENVILGENGTLWVVPKAGMRVLQDNLPFCQTKILEVLHCEH